MARYYIHYNMNKGGEDTATLKDAIRKGYAYLKSHPTSKKVLNIFRQGNFTPMDKNIGTMYWNSMNGKKEIVFDSSNDRPGTFNIAHADGTLSKKIPVNFTTVWKNVNGVTRQVMRKR